MKLRSRCSSLLMSSVLLLARSVSAEAPTDVEAALAQPIVSTPSKSTEPASVAPATTSLITAEDLRSFGIRSLDEAINYLSLGMITSNPLHAVELGARGVLLTADYGNHVLLMIDGHPLNEPWNGTAYFERGAGIPFELIDHIEVTLGPGSALYGSQAMLGVINVVTKNAADYKGLHIIAEGEYLFPSDKSGALFDPGKSDYFARVGKAYRLGLGLGHEFRVFDLPAQLTLQLERYRVDGPAFEFGRQPYGYDSETGRPKSFGPNSPPGVWGGTARDAVFTDVPAAYSRLVIGDVQVLANIGMYHRGVPYLDAVVSDSGGFDDEQNFERDRFIKTEARYRVPLSEMAVLHVRHYADINTYEWHNRDYAVEDCPADLNASCRRVLVGTGRTFGSELRMALEWERSLRLTSLAGVDLKVHDVESDLEVTALAGGARSQANNDFHHTTLPVAAYLQQTVSPLRFMDLNVGARLDYIPRFAARVTPRTAIGVTPWDNGRIKGIYSEAFRAPTEYELFYADPNFQVSAPELKPEVVRSLELSFEQRAGAHRVLFGVFRSWWQNMVQESVLNARELGAAIARGALLPSTSEAYRYRNAGDIDNYGLNGSLEGSLFAERLRYGLNVTEAFTRVDAGDGSAPLPPTVGPQFFGNARLSFQLKPAWPTLGLAAQYQAARATNLAYDSGYVPPPFAPAQFEWKLTLSGAIPRTQTLLYRVGVTHAFASRGAYLIGPLSYAADPSARPEYSPVVRLKAFVGLEYQFDKL